MTTVLSLPTDVQQPHRLLYGFSIMIQKHFFRVFHLFVQEAKHFYQKNIWKNSQITFIYQNDLKHKITLAKNRFGRSRSSPYRSNIFFIYSYSKNCVLLLLVAVTLPVASASCERHFKKMKLVKTFPKNSTTSEGLSMIDLLLIERYELKKDTVDMTIEGLSYIEEMIIWNANVDCAGICARSILLHCLFVWIFLEVVRVSLTAIQS